ncbi:MAG: metal ABC transporter permease [Alphaproteobacteria bacterium]
MPSAMQPCRDWVWLFLAFTLGWDGRRHLPTLLTGAALAAFLAGLSIKWITQPDACNQDVAIASVLSVFYALGIVLFTIAQRFEGAAQAGLDSFLLGQAAGLSMEESLIIAIVALIVLGFIMLFFRDFLLLSFDATFAESIGRPVHRLDIFLTLLVLLIVCAGLKTVGLVLILALLIIPAVTARFWSDRLKPMLLIAAFSGGLSCYVGAALSAAFENIPTGAAIVLCAFTLFSFSFFFSPRHGLLTTRFLHTGKAEKP